MTSPTLTTAHPARHPNPVTKACRLAYLMFERPDLDEAARFLGDFGLATVTRTPDALYMRGAQTGPYCYVVRRARRAAFIGFGVEVPRQEDLVLLSREPGASAVQPCEEPGGGQRVTLTDPSGFRVDAVHGLQLGDPLPSRSPLAFNRFSHPLRVDAGQRPPVRPPEVLRLGHVVIEVADFQATCAWYARTLGFIPSDVQVLPDGSPAVVFMRLDLGDQPADHHTLAIAQGFMPMYSHSAYEVVDTDAVGMGQRILREAGWRHAWGIGRHILGSQIFDYWEDPWGDRHEHYCDGDQMTSRFQMGVHPVSRDAMAQWGESMPRSFTRPSWSLAKVRGLVHHLRRSPDVSLRKLAALARIFG